MRFWKALYLSTFLTFGCATITQPESSLESISMNTQQKEIHTDIPIDVHTEIPPKTSQEILPNSNPQDNLTQRVKELGWDFSKDNGNSFYYTKYISPEYFDYLEACADGVGEELLVILEGDILDKIRKRNLDEFVRIRNLFREVNGNPYDAKKILNSSYTLNIFPTEKELREVFDFRTRFPDSHSTFGIAFDTDRRGILLYDLICGEHTDEDIAKYLGIVNSFERETYTDKNFDISEFQRRLISEVEEATSGRIGFSLVDINNFQYRNQVF